MLLLVLDVFVLFEYNCISGINKQQSVNSSFFVYRYLWPCKKTLLYLIHEHSNIIDVLVQTIVNSLPT